MRDGHLLFGLLLWAVPPIPKYLLLVPLAWALNAAPPNMATGVEADYGMLAAMLTHVIAGHLRAPHTRPVPCPSRAS